GEEDASDRGGNERQHLGKHGLQEPVEVALGPDRAVDFDERKQVTRAEAGRFGGRRELGSEDAERLGHAVVRAASVVRGYRTLRPSAPGQGHGETEQLVLTGRRLI